MRGGPQDPSCADTHPGALGDPHSAALTPTFCPPPSLGPEAECDLQGSQRGAPYARAGSPSVCPTPTATPLGWALPTAGGTQEESRTHNLTRERRVEKASGWMDRMAFQLRSLWERRRDERGHTHRGPVVLALGCGCAGCSRDAGVHGGPGVLTGCGGAGSALLRAITGRRAPYSQGSRGGRHPTHRGRREAGPLFTGVVGRRAP